MELLRQPFGAVRALEQVAVSISVPATSCAATWGPLRGAAGISLVARPTSALIAKLADLE